MKLNKRMITYAGLMIAGAGLWNVATLVASPAKSAQAELVTSSKALPPPDPANIFAGLAAKVLPSVVNISTTSYVRPAGFFGVSSFPFGQELQPQKVGALGSGFIIDPSGIILTNNHVVAGADQIKIQFTEDPNEVPTPGKVIGRDPDLDIALIQVKTNRKLTALPLGDSDALHVGDYVLAAGNPYGDGHSVSHGIVSAKGRTAPGLPLANYLQVDAPINPGNSGGPLVNLKGEVIGINDAIDPRAQGIGFAIPINFAKNVIPQLRAHGTVTRGYIGAIVGPLTPEIAQQLGMSKTLHAPLVTQVLPGSPAEEAGLKPYDAITEVNGKPVHTPSDLVRAITSAPVGKSVSVEISRNGSTRTLRIRTRSKSQMNT